MAAVDRALARDLALGDRILIGDYPGMWVVVRDSRPEGLNVDLDIAITA